MDDADVTFSSFTSCMALFSAVALELYLLWKVLYKYISIENAFLYLFSNNEYKEDTPLSWYKLNYFMLALVQSLANNLI